MDTAQPDLAPETLAVRNPRTGQRDYRIHPPTSAQLDALTAGMRAAQPGWQALGIEGRVAVLRRFVEEAEARKEAIVAALTADTGRRRESESEFNSIKSGVERWAVHAPGQLNPGVDKSTSIPFLTLDQDYVPYALVGVVSPWNFPLLLSLIDAIPALVAGCAVLIKPSEVTPRFAGPLMEAIQAVPELAAVMAYVSGDGRTGQAVIDRVDMVCFTGSVPTGRKVGAQAAANFIPSFLELGGKDPSIVLAGADLDRATSGLVWGSCANTGAACQSIERIYVQSSIHDEFVTRLIEKVNRLSYAYPDPMDGQIGPIIFDRQAEIIRAHLADALAKGAVLHTGRGVEEIDGGLWCFPAVLTGVTHEMTVMREESFGPILPVMAFTDEAEAVRLANDGQYGLSGSVWGPDEDAALRVARQVVGGGISINDTTLTAIMWEGEKQSFRFSGLGGSRMGPTSIRRFVRTKLYIKRQDAGPPADPWWWDTLSG